MIRHLPRWMTSMTASKEKIAVLFVCMGINFFPLAPTG
jgi:hypothetical protein